MVLLTLAASAVYGPAQGGNDEDIQTMAYSTAALSGTERFYRSDLPLWDWRQSQVICDGQHCDIGTAASVGPTDLTAALWLLREPMYVPIDSADDADASEGQGWEVSPAYVRANPDCYADILARYDWDVATMQAIFWRESNCLLDPPHNNPSRGICQAYGPVWQWLLDQYDWAHSPEQAIEMCHVIFERGGYEPWAN